MDKSNAVHNITLICTRHREAGACNSAELLKIIESYQPQIIFEELAPTTYDACYKYNAWGLTHMTTLETDAIKVYRQYHDVKHLPALSAEMHGDLHAMHHKVANRSLDAIADKLDLLLRMYGFKFLNSDECERLSEELKALEKSLLNDDDFFSRAYQCVDTYEYDMLDNIYQYSTENNYDKALMFIGTAHRKTIMQKIKQYQTEHPLKLKWSFYNE